MKLADLRAAGGFVSPAPVKRTVTWTPDGRDPVTFDVWIKRRSFGAIERLFADDDDRSKSAAYIAESIALGEHGKDKLTYEDAYQLEPSLARVLIEALNEVNGTGAAPKN